MTTGTYTTLCYGMCAAFVAVLALFAGQPLVGFEAGGWLGIIAITVCAQLMGHTAFNHLLATMSPLLVSMIILLEIPGAALLAAFFLDETLPAGTYGGLALILVGLAVVVAASAPARPGAADPGGAATGGAGHGLRDSRPQPATGVQAYRPAATGRRGGRAGWC